MRRVPFFSCGHAASSACQLGTQLYNACTRANLLYHTALPAGNRFASGGVDTTIKVWQLDTPDLLAAIEDSYTYDVKASKLPFDTRMVEKPAFSTMRVHPDYIDSVHWIGDMLLTKCYGAQAHQMVLWTPNPVDIPDGVTIIAEYQVKDCDVWFVRGAVHPSCAYIALGSVRGKIMLFPLFDEAAVDESSPYPCDASGHPIRVAPLTTLHSLPPWANSEELVTAFPDLLALDLGCADVGEGEGTGVATAGIRRRRSDAASATSTATDSSAPVVGASSGGGGTSGLPVESGSDTGVAPPSPAKRARTGASPPPVGGDDDEASRPTISTVEGSGSGMEAPLSSPLSADTATPSVNEAASAVGGSADSVAGRKNTRAVRPGTVAAGSIISASSAQASLQKLAEQRDGGVSSLSWERDLSTAIIPVKHTVGHKDCKSDIRQVVFTPDGKSMIAICSDASIWRWMPANIETAASPMSAASGGLS